VSQLARFLRFVVYRFEENENRKSAAALTFVSLFAIVPLMTAGYTVLTLLPWFGSFAEQFQEFVFQHFIPASGEALKDHLKSFAEQAKNLTWIGITLLLVSAISLMFTIEGAFNRVWRVKSVRMGRRLVLYWLVILLGPLLLAAGFLISSYVLSSQLWVNHVESVIQIQGHLIAKLPYILTSFALCFMYYFIPSCKVDFLYALAGGLIAGAMFEGCKLAFVKLASLVPSYQIVYGAFAVVPLFLIWIFIAWCVVLLGAELVRAMPFILKEWRGVKASPLDWALIILSRMAKDDGHGVSRISLMNVLSLPDVDDWESVLVLLMEQQWIANSADTDRFYLKVNLANKSVGELSEIIHGKRLEKFAVIHTNNTWAEKLTPILADLRAQKKTALGLSIASVICPNDDSSMVSKPLKNS